MRATSSQMVTAAPHARVLMHNSHCGFYKNTLKNPTRESVLTSMSAVVGGSSAGMWILSILATTGSIVPTHKGRHTYTHTYTRARTQTHPHRHKHTEGERECMDTRTHGCNIQNNEHADTPMVQACDDYAAVGLTASSMSTNGSLYNEIQEQNGPLSKADNSATVHMPCFTPTFMSTCH